MLMKQNVNNDVTKDSPIRNTFSRNNIIVCFKATFLLCHKISSNRETAKQQPTKGSDFLCSPHDISVALNIRIVFTIKD